MVLIFHLCKLCGELCVFLSVALLFGATDFAYQRGARLHNVADTLMKCPCFTVLRIFHQLLSESCAIPHIFLACEVWHVPIFTAFEGSRELAALPARLKVKSHIKLNSAHVSYS